MSRRVTRKVKAALGCTGNPRMALRAPHFFLSNVTYKREGSGPADLGSRSCSSGCEVEGTVGEPFRCHLCVTSTALGKGQIRPSGAGRWSLSRKNPEIPVTQQISISPELDQVTPASPRPRARFAFPQDPASGGHSNFPVHTHPGCGCACRYLAAPARPVTRPLGDAGA